LEMLTRAFNVFERERDRPTLIIVDSHIGYGAPTKEGTAQAHGEPLGEEEVRATKRFYGAPEDLTFHVPQGIYEHFAAGIGARGRRRPGATCTSACGSSSPRRSATGCRCRRSGGSGRRSSSSPSSRAARSGCPR